VLKAKNKIKLLLLEIGKRFSKKGRKNLKRVLELGIEVVFFKQIWNNIACVF
jgi:hypothetical protein